jgi:hypothetical protein
LSAEYRCGLSYVLPAAVYACREFDVKVHLSCHLESGTGPSYVEPAGVPLGWWLNGRYLGLTSTDASGWSSRRFHIEEPGVHTILVRFFGAARDNNYYRPADAEIKVSVEPAPPPIAPPAPPVSPPQAPLALVLTYVGAMIPLVFVGSVMAAQVVVDPPQEVAVAGGVSPLYEEAYRCAERKGLKRRVVDALASYAKAMVNYVIRRLESGVEEAFAKYRDYKEEGIEEARAEALKILDRVVSDAQEWYNLIRERIESLGFKPPLTQEDMDSIRRDIMRVREMMEKGALDYDVRRYIDTVLARWFDRKYTLVAEAMIKAGLLSCP